LDEFAGTIVVVSHDRYFLDRVVDRVFELHDGELRLYEGGYSYYAEEAARRDRPAPVELREPVRQPAAKPLKAGKGGR
jgi:ATPase subunit of ABC transporter with duplicated ATPase domains